MTLSLFILAAVIMVGGSLLQTVAGFGYGMFAIPLLMMWVGFESYEAIACVAMCVAGQTLSGMWTLRKDIDWKLAGLMILISGAVLPLGVYAQDVINAQLDRSQVRQIFGVMILTALGVQLVAKVHQRERVHWIWCVLAMAIAGFMGGLAGMGGPAAVMWVMAHNWTTHRSRVMLWTLFMGLMPLQFVFLTLQFGSEVVDATVWGLILAPFTLLGLIPGLWIGRHMSKTLLRRLGFSVLGVVSVWAIVQPWI